MNYDDETTRMYVDGLLGKKIIRIRLLVGTPQTVVVNSLGGYSGLLITQSW